MEEIQKNIQKQEEQMIAKIEEENKQSDDIPPYHDPDYMPPTDEEGYLPEEMEMLEPEEERTIHLRKTRKRKRK